MSIFYPGIKKTCGRCHEIGTVCVGGGIAKVCNEKGGAKVKLEDKMLAHWKDIGFCSDGGYESLCPKNGGTGI